MSAITRRQEDLTGVVDRVGDPVRIAGERGEFLDFPLVPDDRLNAEDLWGYASRVGRRILRKPDHLASVVDARGLAIIAAERGKRAHHASSPNKGETYKGIATKILS